LFLQETQNSEEMHRGKS